MAAVGQWGRRLRQVFLLTAWDRVKPGNPGGKGELGRKVSLASDTLKVPKVPTRRKVPHSLHTCLQKLCARAWTLYLVYKDELNGLFCVFVLSFSSGKQRTRLIHTHHCSCMAGLYLFARLLFIINGCGILSKYHVFIIKLICTK